MSKMFKKLMESKKASVGMVVALIVTIAVLVIGVYILYQFTLSIPSIPAGTANTTATNIINAGWSAMSLSVIIPIIVVAGVIIGYLVRGFAGGAGGR